MSVKANDAIRQSMREKSTQELQNIWNLRSRGDWTAAALEVVREELLARNEVAEGEIENVGLEESAAYQTALRTDNDPKKMETISRNLRLAGTLGAFMPLLVDPLGLDLKEGMASGASRPIVGIVVWSFMILVLLALSDTVFRPRKAAKSRTRNSY